MTAETSTLLLDDRRRAMLREMGVQVWLPRAVPVADVAAAPAPAAVAEVPVQPSTRTEAPRVAEPPPAVVARQAPPPPVAAPAATSVPSSVASTASTVSNAVLRGDWLALSTPEGDDPQAPVWLLLVDSPGADPRVGDAGRLLDAMLRAAGLHRGARVWAAGVGRAGEPGQALDEALGQAIVARKPAMVLALGRLSAQAALGRNEPLGKLRGTVHRLEGAPLVASYEPAWLLRAQDDKARAWEDLCRALAAVAEPRP
ncbi:uracil-DNA glycosylase family protein [Xylophilus sp. GOD-11R]|uniref:uracil-DNA glycosylase family protein n=1 Tax=Xylophilus sp. GOD-11R TaxID=3089814 RepID=UPI00298C64B4|nr:uracil-DNA glycosylase family protein [Xylophilus sp. GOD-11R]WPB56929.1 uracil-DNA glycosylase family protein [Xylophilus sp. GOD-11R]